MSESPSDEQTCAVAQPHRIRLRIVHILYVVALLASGLATFGARGMVPSLVVLGVWTPVFVSRSRPRAWATVCLLMVIGFCVLGVVLPALRPTRTRPYRMSCNNNLKNIGLALNNYHDTYGTFPPAHIPDKNGKPIHSWRVLILPFMEYRNLYDAYDFTEPWDGPKNRKLLVKMPAPYVCPDRPASGEQDGLHISYFAVVGPKTMWPDAKSRQIREIKDADGTSHTLLVIEALVPEVAWSEPRDLSYDEAVRLLSSRDSRRVGGHLVEDFFYEHYFSRHAALVDGSVHFVHRGLPRETATALLTIDDGYGLEEGWSSSGNVSAKRPKLGNWYRLAVFVLLMILPLPWVWISPRRSLPSQK